MPLGGIVSSGYGKGGGGGGSGDGIEYVAEFAGGCRCRFRYHLRSTNLIGLCGPAKIQRLYDGSVYHTSRIYGLLCHLQ